MTRRDRSYAEMINETFPSPRELQEFRDSVLGPNPLFRGELIMEEIHPDQIARNAEISRLVADAENAEERDRRSRGLNVPAYQQATYRALEQISPMVEGQLVIGEGGWRTGSAGGVSSRQWIVNSPDPQPLTPERMQEAADLIARGGTGRPSQMMFTNPESLEQVQRLVNARASEARDHLTDSARYAASPAYRDWRVTGDFPENAVTMTREEINLREEINGCQSEVIRYENMHGISGVLHWEERLEKARKALNDYYDRMSMAPSTDAPQEAWKNHVRIETRGNQFNFAFMLGENVESYEKEAWLKELREMAEKLGRKRAEELRVKKEMTMQYEKELAQKVEENKTSMRNFLNELPNRAVEASA